MGASGPGQLDTSTTVLPPEVQGTLLERPVLLFVEAERLGDVVDLEGTDGEVHGDLDVLGEVALEATEQPE